MKNWKTFYEKKVPVADGSEKFAKQNDNGRVSVTLISIKRRQTGYDADLKVILSLETTQKCKTTITLLRRYCRSLCATSASRRPNLVLGK
ncbi:hypothetical protein NPIL_579531 [Nephila pilipes]|uniref:Uncharacterized protein n=1 Tax=Nephila pilipes TaxID=299642 RepID=A0A8X6NU86_NEPPI|nr:hypothetical protein NPIL_579531 [Nephila pilipes]